MPTGFPKDKHPEMYEASQPKEEKRAYRARQFGPGPALITLLWNAFTTDEINKSNMLNAISMLADAWEKTNAK